MALKKALFKPGAWFKGILIPLCESGTCTLREAIIVGSIITKCSIPVLHSSAAMLKIAEMEYSGANSIFLRLLLDKKYALPYRVLDALVFHFLGFRTEKRELPVLWHQCLLTLVQRYKADLATEQKEALLELLRLQPHPSCPRRSGVSCRVPSPRCRRCSRHHGVRMQRSSGSADRGRTPGSLLVTGGDSEP